MSKQKYTPKSKEQPPRYNGSTAEPYNQQYSIPGVDHWQRPTSLLRNEATGCPPHPPFFQNTPPTISWMCSCSLCVRSVEEFMASLRNTGGLYSSYIATSGPTYNSLLTSVMGPVGTDGSTAGPTSNGNSAPGSSSGLVDGTGAANPVGTNGSSNAVGVINNVQSYGRYGEPPSYFYYSPSMNYASPFMSPRVPQMQMPNYFNNNYHVNPNWIPYGAANGINIPNHGLESSFNTGTLLPVINIPVEDSEATLKEQETEDNEPIAEVVSLATENQTEEENQENKGSVADEEDSGVKRNSEDEEKSQ